MDDFLNIVAILVILALGVAITYALLRFFGIQKKSGDFGFPEEPEGYVKKSDSSDKRGRNT